MTRVDELQKRYPSLQRQYIVRADCKVHGMRDTGELDEFGRWARMAEVYANSDFDITVKDWVEARPGRQKPGHILRPGKFVHPENGLKIDTDKINTKSDLQVRREGNATFALYQGDERVEEIWYRPQKEKDIDLTSTAKPEWEFFARKSKHCFLITPVRHCEYFPLGVACKFCNLNPGLEDARSVGLERSTTVNVKETLEAYKKFASETKIVEGAFVLGGFSKTANETRISANFIEKLASAVPYKPNFKLVTQPMDKKDMRRLKDVGADCVGFNMEIWDPDLFPEVVPGKAQYRGRDRYLEAYQEAVDVFGAGNVMTLFPGGLDMMPENGHRTWQEARDSMVEGMTWMIRQGVLPCVNYLWLSPGSAYGSDEYRKKMPPTEYYLEVALAHNEACKKYGLYDKLNRLMVCPLDNLTASIRGELGAYDVAGSLANWADAVLPREANCHRDWEEQHRSAATTR